MNRTQLFTWALTLSVGLFFPATSRAEDGLAEQAQSQDLDRSEYEDLRARLAEVELELRALREERDERPRALPGISPGAADSIDAVFSSDEPEVAALPPPVIVAPPSAPTYPTVKVGGFFQADTLFFGQDPDNRRQLGDIEDGADFRRTRLSAGGSVAPNVNYFVQMDFGFLGRPTFTDVWGEVTEVPLLGTVRVGQWKQPFALEVATSVRYQTFMERSLLFQTFEAFRHIGVGSYDHSEDEYWTWALSGFRTGNDQFGNDIGDAGGWSTAGRLTHLLWYDAYDCLEDQQRLEYLHLGGAFWFGDPGNDVFQYRTIPEAFLGAFGVPAGTVPGTSRAQVPTIANGTPPFVDTGAIPTNTFTHIGAELLWVNGPFSWQSEAQLAHVAQTGNADPTFWGFYSQVMYFLTGESRPYNRKLGQLERIVPRRPFLTSDGCVQGPGAWEIAARVSHINLNSEAISGGTLTDVTLGLNWYLNGHTKLQFNYIHAFLDRNFNGFDGKSDADIVGARVQVDF